MECAVDGCPRKPRNKNGKHCNMHMLRLRIHGDVGEAEPRHILSGWVAPREPNTGMAWCTKCRLELPFERFDKSSKRPNGLQEQCKPCRFAGRILKSYGMTVEDYARMFNEQGAGCAICHRSNRKVFHIDHDHNCCPPGKGCSKCIRGILCGPCNHVLGLVHDNADLFQEFANYLNGWLLPQETSCQIL